MITENFTSDIILTGFRGVSATVCCAAATYGIASTDGFVGAGTVDAGSGDRSGHIQKHLVNHPVSQNTQPAMLPQIDHVTSYVSKFVLFH